MVLIKMTYFYCFFRTIPGVLGLKLSGAVAKVVMLNWSRKFKACVSTALANFDYFQLYMLLFYVDDTGIAVEELEPGCRFIKEEGRVRVVEEEVEGDKGVKGDLRTALVLSEVANSIFDYIQFTVDCPLGRVDFVKFSKVANGHSGFSVCYTN